MRRLPLFVLSAVACMPVLTNQPVRFVAPVKEADPLDDLTRELVANSLSVASTDPKLGILQTRWENTGFGYGFLQDGRGAVIWRRYTVMVARRDANADVTVRAETQRCDESAKTLDGTNIDGTCTPMTSEGLVADHQAQLDKLGAELRTALHGG